MKVLAKYFNKAVIYRENEKQCFVVAETNAKVGDEIREYVGGRNYYTNNLVNAVLKLYNINYNIESIQTVMDNVDLDDFGIFECEICGETHELCERCTEHHEKWDNVCQDCCENCRKEIDYD